MKSVSFKALQQMAREFDDLSAETDCTYKSAMDFYLYVVDNYETVEEEIRQDAEANS